MIDKDQFDEWLDHPVTMAAIILLEKKREGLRMDWEYGRLTTETCEGTAMKSVNSIGVCEGIAAFTELVYEDFITEAEDGKQVGVETPGSSGAD